ncbi:hypothetical protein ADUPG1_012408 [Aduncisulcus paluster]|uniref:Transposase n=1 Tax=Aduncisulcus paluster TaxID=2918883 RepID=A0ABQ5K1J1_9EUKA|nr:hypothetical protein ADUPG1_012408 [Aduncisulcus paluster]
MAMIDETRVKDKDGTADMILEKEARLSIVWDSSEIEGIIKRNVRKCLGYPSDCPWSRDLSKKHWKWAPITFFADGVSSSPTVRNLCVKATLAHWSPEKRRKDSSIFEIAMINEVSIDKKDFVAAQTIIEGGKIFENGIIDGENIILGGIHSIIADSPQRTSVRTNWKGLKDILGTTKDNPLYIILDNAKIHHMGDAIFLAESLNIVLIFLPAYSQITVQDDSCGKNSLYIGGYLISVVADSPQRAKNGTATNIPRWISSMSSLFSKVKRKEKERKKEEE